MSDIQKEARSPSLRNRYLDLVPLGKAGKLV